MFTSIKHLYSNSRASLRAAFDCAESRFVVARQLCKSAYHFAESANLGCELAHVIGQHLRAFCQRLVPFHQSLYSLIDIHTVFRFMPPLYTQRCVWSRSLCNPVFTALRTAAYRHTNYCDTIRDMSPKNPAAVALGRRGGKATAENRTAEQRSEAARKAVKARWAKADELLNKLERSESALLSARLQKRSAKR
jgi:hypothetical protein